MYSHNLGLSQDPFSIAPDPRFLFMSERHREALAHLLYGVSAPDTGASSSGGAGGGFVLLTGEIGTGKTTVCRGFLEQIPANCHVAYIFNPKLTVAELLQSICEEFHIAAAITQGPDIGAEPAAILGTTVASLKQHIDALNVFLLASHAAGKSCVLIIDEAQNLMPEVLEQLRLLTNLETNERKLLQIVLIGQPELRTMLNRPELEQLAQRVIARYHLTALNGAETEHYITHRLAVAGHTGALPFDVRAVARVHAITHGVPRRINLLCGRALLGAWATGQQRVNRTVVDKAALEVFGPDALIGLPARMGKPAWVALIGLVVLAGAAGIGYVATGFDTAVTPTTPLSRAASVQPSSAALSSTAPTAMQAADPPPAGAASDALPPSLPTSSGGGRSTSSESSQTPASPAHTPVDAETLLPRLLTQQATAWRSLGTLWALPATGGNSPCQTAALQQLQCMQTTKLTLPQLRQLGRPGILTLAAGEQRPAYGVLLGLGTQTAILQVDGVPQVVWLSSLGRLWQGDFATYWQPPPGFVLEPHDGSSGPAIDTLANLLARVETKDGLIPATASIPVAGQRLDPALRQRVRAFQRTQGLIADGHPGPLTFMQLESTLGLNSPRLLTE